MSIPLNSFSSFNSTLQTNVQKIPRCYSGASKLKARHIPGSVGSWFGSQKSIKNNRLGPFIFATDGNQVTEELRDKDSGNVGRPASNNQFSAAKAQASQPPSGKIILKSNAKGESTAQTPEVSGVPSDETASSVKPPKRLPLTAREKLRAARVLSRYTESKPSKSEFGSKVLDALKESERGKRRSGLPEAPTNLFDDQRRGLPKQGLTFDFPGGVDLFIIVCSFVLISTIMFTTTYFVWKVGAIHFNEN